MPSAWNVSPLDDHPRYIPSRLERHSDSGRPGIAADEKPRFLLVLADSEGDIGRQARRHRRGAARQGRRDAPRRGMRQEPDAAHGARRRNRKLRAGGAAGGRGRARHDQARSGDLAPAGRRTVPRQHATIGGFIAGGAAGAGSCTWGQISDPGAVLAVEVVTIEEHPRVVELRGRDVLKVMHAYGVNGIITEVEVPLAPSHPWCERIAAFPSLSAAARFAHAFTECDGIAKKLVTVHDPQVVPHLRRLAPYAGPGQAMVIIMVSEPQAEALELLAT